MGLAGQTSTAYKYTLITILSNTPLSSKISQWLRLSTTWLLISARRRGWGGGGGGDLTYDIGFIRNLNTV